MACEISTTYSNHLQNRVAQTREQSECLVPQAQYEIEAHVHLSGDARLDTIGMLSKCARGGAETGAVLCSANCKLKMHVLSRVLCTWARGGATYGWWSRNTCPTREHGIVSIRPPQVQIRNEISRFSAPQTSMPRSYEPTSQNQARSIANNPPA
jgi:hypothetical protein